MTKDNLRKIKLLVNVLQKGIIRFKEVTEGASLVAQVVKNPANAGATGDMCLILQLGRSPGEEKGNPLQNSCLGIPVGRGAWRATTHGVAKSQTRT